MEEGPGRLRKTDGCGLKSRGVNTPFGKEVDGQMLARGLSGKNWRCGCREVAGDLEVSVRPGGRTHT